MRKISKSLQSPTQSFQTEFAKAVNEIQTSVFVSVLKSSLSLPLVEPPLGAFPEACKEKLDDYMEPIFYAAYSASIEAARSAIRHMGPLSKFPPIYAAEARAQCARKAEEKRKYRNGGRPQTVRWRREAKEIWMKNCFLTATDMLSKLEARGLLQCDAGRIVFNDDLGLRTEKSMTKKRALAALNTLKNQTFKEVK